MKVHIMNDILMQNQKDLYTIVDLAKQFEIPFEQIIPSLAVASNSEKLTKALEILNSNYSAGVNSVDEPCEFEEEIDEEEDEEEITFTPVEPALDVVIDFEGLKIADSLKCDKRPERDYTKDPVTKYRDKKGNRITEAEWLKIEFGIDKEEEVIEEPDEKLYEYTTACKTGKQTMSAPDFGDLEELNPIQFPDDFDEDPDEDYPILKLTETPVFDHDAIKAAMLGQKLMPPTRDELQEEYVRTGMNYQDALQQTPIDPEMYARALKRHNTEPRIQSNGFSKFSSSEEYAEWKNNPFIKTDNRHINLITLQEMISDFYFEYIENNERITDDYPKLREWFTYYDDFLEIASSTGTLNREKLNRSVLNPFKKLLCKVGILAKRKTIVNGKKKEYLYNKDLQCNMIPHKHGMHKLIIRAREDNDWYDVIEEYLVQE